MNIHCFNLNDFPNHLAVGCFKESLLGFYKQKSCRWVFAKEIVAELCVEMPVSYFCMNRLLFSLLFVLQAHMNNSSVKSL